MFSRLFRSRRRARARRSKALQSRGLWVEPLEPRIALTVGVFVEDFTSDTSPGASGFDTPADGLHIKQFILQNNAALVTGPAGSASGSHALRIAPELASGYSAVVPPTGPGSRASLGPGERITTASAMVFGEGRLVFQGDKGGIIVEVNTPGQWQTITVDETMVGDQGVPIGPLYGISANGGPTRGEMYVDDIAMVVATGAPGAGAGVVRIRRFGDAMGIVGDDGNNSVRVEILYDTAGTVRVFGLGQTRLEGNGPEIVQNGFFEVTVTGVSSDVLINLNDGVDFLDVERVGNTPVLDALTRFDDLLINMGKGENDVEFHGVVADFASIKCKGPHADGILMTDQTFLRRVQIDTDGGNDFVELGQAGPNVFDGESNVDLVIVGEIPGENGVRVGSSRVETGKGDDRVLAAGILQWVEFNLGAGLDRLRFESAEVYFGEVTRLEELEMIESAIGVIEIELSALRGFTNIIRLDRVVQPANQWELASSQARIIVEMPAGGTELKKGAEDFVFPFSTPAENLDVLRNRIFAGKTSTLLVVRFGFS